MCGLAVVEGQITGMASPPNVFVDKKLRYVPTESLLPRVIRRSPRWAWVMAASALAGVGRHAAHSWVLSVWLLSKPVKQAATRRDPLTVSEDDPDGLGAGPHANPRWTAHVLR